jgi:hypothetical protein
VEDTFVSLLPNLPKNKPWEELPDVIQYGVVVSD